MDVRGTQQSLPRPVRTLIFFVALGGLVATAGRIPDAIEWSLRDAIVWACLATTIAAAEQFPILVRNRTQTLNLSVTDAIWAGALLTVRPSILTLAVGAGVVAGQAIRHRPLEKIAFNAGQFLIGIILAQEIFAALGSEDVLLPSSWIAAAVSMAAFFVVNATIVALAISWVEGASFWKVLLPPLVPNLLHWAANTAMGVLGAVVWATDPRRLPLLSVPIALSYFAYRAWVQGARERERMRNLYEAGRSLMAPLESGADFRPFLLLVKRMLEASTVELVVMDRDRVTIHDSNGTTRALKPSKDRHHGPESYIDSRPGPAPQVKVIGTSQELRGVLAVYRNQMLAPSEQSLLDALATQIYVMLENHRIYFETLEQAQLSDIITQTSDGLFIVSPDHHVMSWNPAMEDITGYSQAEAIGRPFEEVLGLGPAQPEPGGGALGEAGDTAVVRKDGAHRWIRYSRSPMSDRSGGLKAHVIVAKDVTVQVEAERLKADFVATVSHELRTPLTPLKGFLQSLVQGTADDSPAARHEYYGIMLKQCNRLERLITDLLEVSRIESGTALLVDGQVMEVTSVVREQVQDFIRDNPGREIRLRTQGMSVMVHADPFRIGQVVANLLSNALKYSPADAPVELRVVADRRDVTVSVWDRGEGILPEDRARVFERFHRVENGLTRSTGGTGLGLYIAKKLMEAMNGTIWVESEPGAGSVFSFGLPLVRTVSVVPSLPYEVDAVSTIRPAWST